MRLILLIALLSQVATCGQKGPLELPAGQTDQRGLVEYGA